MASAATETIGRIAGNRNARRAAAALAFLAISTVFFNKIFTSDYGTHLAIGRHFVETGKVPDREFLIYPLLGQPMNFEELGFQAILYSVYRLVGSNGVSVFVWMVATLAFLFVYLSLRARDIRPVIALATMLVLALPFRIRLQPRPEIIAYLFCSFIMYACSLYYYRGNRKIIYYLPLVFLVWSNLHPSTLAGLATIGAFGTQSLVVVWKDRFDKGSLKNNLLIPLGILALCVIASFLNKHGVDSLLTPLRIVANPLQMSSISEMASIRNSGFWGHYKWIFGLVVAYGVVGLAAWRIRIHDVVMAAYGLKLPLQVARGMAFMSIFTIPLVAQSFEGAVGRIGEYLKTRRQRLEEEAARAAAKSAREARGSKKKGRGRPNAEQEPEARQTTVAPPPALAFRLWIAVAWVVLLAPLGVGAYTIRAGTRDIVENGIGLTEHKFSLKSAEFLRGLDIKGNMFNFFDLGGFLDWQLVPEKRPFIDGRAGNAALFMEHQMVSSAMGGFERILDKYAVTYVVSKVADSSGMVLPLVNYLSQSPNWELVFADGLAVVFVRNSPENRPIIDRYRIPKGVIGDQIISELIHYTYLGVNKSYAYSVIGNVYMGRNDLVNARKFYGMAYEESRGDPNLAAMVNRIEAMGGGQGHPGPSTVGGFKR